MQAPGKGGLNPEYDDRPGVVLARPFALVLLVVLMLSVDELNPVKIMCLYTNGYICRRLLSWGSLIWLFWLLALNLQKCIYYSIKLFLRSTINNIFFRSVEIIGMENVPKEGPVILAGNHSNQFVDATLLLTNCKRQISFLIAEKSWHRPMVGFLARAFHSIPVSRPQDVAVKGSGEVILNGTASVRGEGTKFLSEVKEVGAQLQVPGLPEAVKVKEIISDTELLVAGEAGNSGQQAVSAYKILPKVDQSSMYGSVFQCLQQGRCLGIFPEGGSHDRTDLLPLKAGVAIIALEAAAKHKVDVPIVPVGLNYFRGHHFRGRVVIEFGAPMHIQEATHQAYEESKRKGTELLLKQVETAMRAVIVPAPNYKMLQTIYTARRLYVKDGTRLTTDQTMDLDRRFAVGIHRILSVAKQSGDYMPDDDQDMDDERDVLSPQGLSVSQMSFAESDASTSDTFKFETDDKLVRSMKHIGELAGELTDYMKALKRLGLKDYQVMHIRWWSFADLIGRTLFVAVLLCLGTVPQVLFNLPVGLLARALAVKEQHKALKASNVKVAARDVLMSYKIIYCLCFLPVLNIFYLLCLIFFSGLTWTSIVLLYLCLPLFSFGGVKASEQGVRVWTDVVPLISRLLPARRREQDALPARRATLQLQVRRAVKECGPLVSNIYNATKVDWSKELSQEGAQWKLPDGAKPIRRHMSSSVVVQSSTFS